MGEKRRKYVFEANKGVIFLPGNVRVLERWIFSCLFVFSLARIVQGSQIPPVGPKGMQELIKVCSSFEADEYLRKRKWAEAKACYSDLIKKDPDWLPGWLGLATSLVHLGHREEALKQLQQATEVVRPNRRGQLLRRIQVLPRLFLTNTTFQVYQDGLTFLASRKFKMATEKFERALNEEEGNVEVLFRMGQSAFLDGNSKEALSYLKSAKKLDSDDPEIRLWLGRVYQSLRKDTEALVELKEAYHKLNDPNRPVRKDLEASALWYAEALVSTRQYPLAMKILAQDFKANSSHFFSLIALAKLRVQIARTEPSHWNHVRKELNLALERLELAQSLSSNLSEPSADKGQGLPSLDDSLALVQDKSLEEVKADILGFLKQFNQQRSSKKS